MAAARLGMDVRALVGVDGEAATSRELDVLRDAGVHVRRAPIDHGPVFDNRQTPTGRVQFSDGPSDPIPVAALPADWRAPTAAILAPVAGELGNDWATAFEPRTTIAVGLQGFVRKLVPRARVEPLPLTRSRPVERAQMLLISAEDVAGGAPPLAELLDPKQELVLTQGEAGALYVHGTARRYVPSLPKRDPVDATGAGDVFLGAWVAARLLAANAEPWRALVTASAMASLSVQARTIAEFPTTTELCEVLVRLRDRHLD